MRSLAPLLLREAALANGAWLGRGAPDNTQPGKTLRCGNFVRVTALAVVISISGNLDST